VAAADPDTEGVTVTEDSAPLGGGDDGPGRPAEPSPRAIPTTRRVTNDTRATRERPDMPAS